MAFFEIVVRQVSDYIAIHQVKCLHQKFGCRKTRTPSSGTGPVYMTCWIVPRLRVDLNHRHRDYAVNALPDGRTAFLSPDGLAAIHNTLPERPAGHTKKGFGATGPNPCYRRVSVCSGRAP